MVYYYGDAATDPHPPFLADASARNGGPGKTTTSIDLDAGLSGHGYQVVVFDSGPAEDPGDDEEYDPERQTTIRAKWQMDGATTLAEAAAKVRAFAGKLDQMAREGWELEAEVADDYGHCVRTVPAGGPS